MSYAEHWRAFSPEWFRRHQRGLLWLLNAPIAGQWLRRVLRITKHDLGHRGPILEIFPHGYTVPGSEPGTLAAEFRTHSKYSKRLYHAFRPLWWLLHWWDSLVADKLVPALSFGFDTLTAYPDPNPEVTTCDGFAAAVSFEEVWSALQAETGNSASAAIDPIQVVKIRSGAALDNWSDLTRGFFLFDIHAVYGGRVTAATLSLFGDTTFGAKSDACGITPDINIYSSNPASNTDIVPADFQAVGSVPFSATISYASWTQGIYNNFALNADGLAAVNGVSIAKFATRNVNYDVANVSPTWPGIGLISFLRAAASEQAGTSSDPKLVVTYTPYDASIDVHTSKPHIVKQHTMIGY